MADDAVCGARRRSGVDARTSTASRSAAWSPSSSRCATPSACASLVLGATHAGRPARGRAPTPRSWRSSAAALTHARGGGRLGVGAVQLRPALPRASTPTASRRTSRSRLAHPFTEQRLPRAAVRRGAAQLLRAAARASTPRRSSSTARHDRMIPVANAQLLAERIPGARLRILEESGHLYPTEEPEVDEEIAAFLARSAGAEGAAVIDLTSARRRRAARRRRRPRAGRRARATSSRSGTASARSPTRELDERSNRLAQALLAAGVRPGLARRVPRPHRARGRRAAVRGEQDRRRRRAAQLAAGGARARARSWPTPARRC